MRINKVLCMVMALIFMFSVLVFAERPTKQEYRTKLVDANIKISEQIVVLRDGAAQNAGAIAMIDVLIADEEKAQAELEVEIEDLNEKIDERAKL